MSINRRQEIIKAAAKVFREKGYYNATIQDIANEVGLLKGSLYYYIESKEVLLLEILMDGVNVLSQRLKKVIETDLDPREKLSRAIQSFMQAVEEKNNEIGVYVNEVSNLPEGLRPQFKAGAKKYEAMWMKLLEDGVKEGYFQPGLESKVVLYAILGMCLWTNKWFKLDGRLAAGDIGETFSSIIINGILTASESKYPV